MIEYEKQAQDFLDKHGIRFKAVLKGDRCPMWDDEKHIHGDRHLITFIREGKRFSLSFWNSYSDSQEGKLPTPYDVLASIQKYDVGDFEDFCGDFGYDTDSRKAEKTYKAVVKEYEKASDFFSGEELEEAQEIN